MAPAGEGFLGAGEVTEGKHYTKYEYRIPMRDGVKLFTAVYVPKDTSQTYPILLTRTPYSVGPTASISTPTTSARRRSSARKATSSSTRTSAAAGCPKGRSSTCGRTIRPRRGRKDIDESTDTYDTIDWLLKNVPNHNGKVGQWGISYPGFYTAAGMIDAHPALKAASPQAPVTDWFIGDDWHHNGAFFLPHAFNFMPRFGKPRPEPTKKPLYPKFDYGTPDGYDFFLRLGPLANVDAKYFKGEVAVLERTHAARHLRRLLEGPQPAPAPEEHQARRPDRRRLVRRREPVRRPGDLQAASRRNSPARTTSWSWAPGSTAAGTAVKPTAPRLATSRSTPRPPSSTARKIELPFFEFHLKGKGRSQAAEGLGLRDRARTVWREYATPGRRRTRSR